VKWCANIDKLTWVLQILLQHWATAQRSLGKWVLKRFLEPWWGHSAHHSRAKVGLPLVIFCQQCSCVMAQCKLWKACWWTGFKIKKSDLWFLGVSSEKSAKLQSEDQLCWKHEQFDVVCHGDQHCAHGFLTCVGLCPWCPEQGIPELFPSSVWSLLVSFLAFSPSWANTGWVHCFACTDYFDDFLRKKNEPLSVQMAMIDSSTTSKTIQWRWWPLVVHWCESIPFFLKMIREKSSWWMSQHPPTKEPSLDWGTLCTRWDSVVSI